MDGQGPLTSVPTLDRRQANRSTPSRDSPAQSQRLRPVSTTKVLREPPERVRRRLQAERRPEPAVEAWPTAELNRPANGGAEDDHTQGAQPHDGIAPGTARVDQIGADGPPDDAQRRRVTPGDRHLDRTRWEDIVSGHMNHNLKLRNVERDPRVVLSFDAPAEPGTFLNPYAILKATATVEPGEHAWESSIASPRSTSRQTRSSLPQRPRAGCCAIRSSGSAASVRGRQARADQPESAHHDKTASEPPTSAERRSTARAERSLAARKRPPAGADSGSRPRCARPGLRAGRETHLIEARFTGESQRTCGKTGRHQPCAVTSLILYGVSPESRPVPTGSGCWWASAWSYSKPRPSRNCCATGVGDRDPRARARVLGAAHARRRGRPHRGSAARVCARPWLDHTWDRCRRRRVRAPTGAVLRDRRGAHGPPGPWLLPCRRLRAQPPMTAMPS